MQAARAIERKPEMITLVLLTMMPFVWLGLVVAISFIETPLKFRAPGVTHALGVGIGRIVFKVLNRVEAVIAMVILVAWTQQRDLVSVGSGLCLTIAILALVLQMLVLRPAMAHRTKALSDTALTHSGDLAVKAKISTLTHIFYISSELVKVTVLPIAGILTLLAVAA